MSPAKKGTVSPERRGSVLKPTSRKSGNLGKKLFKGLLGMTSFWNKEEIPEEDS